jgi:hypothetical protein
MQRIESPTCHPIFPESLMIHIYIALWCNQIVSPEEPNNKETSP